MVLTGILLFALCLVLSAFFSSSETAFIAANPYSLEYREKQGSKGAALARRIKARTNDLLAAILLGNTLVNAAAASIATSVLTGLLPAGQRNRAVLYATAATTFLLLVFGEINPKTFAAHNSVRLASLFAYPLRGVMVLLSPLVKLFNLMTHLIMPSSRASKDSPGHRLNEEETRIALRAGARNLSSLRRRIVSGALDMGSRPVKEVMVPRPEIKALEIESGREAILAAIRSTGYSRYPVYRTRLDNIEGIVHSKDIIGHLIDNKAFAIKDVMRRPMFVPDLASLEMVLLQMQEQAVHMALVVDEFGNVDGLVTLEDIIEEIIGEFTTTAPGGDAALQWVDDEVTVDGAAPLRELNRRLGTHFPLDGPRTLNGLLLETLRELPEAATSVRYGPLVVEIQQIEDRLIRSVRLRRRPSELSPHAAEDDERAF